MNCKYIHLKKTQAALLELIESFDVVNFFTSNKQSTPHVQSVYAICELSIPASTFNSTLCFTISGDTVQLNGSNG